MGEDPYIYSSGPQASTTSYAHSFPVKLEGQDDPSGMALYAPDNADSYSVDQKIMAPVGRKSANRYQDEMMEFNHGRPQLHHMASLSTTCTVDSFHSSAVESGEVSAFDLSPSESQEFEWSLHASNQFQWPANRMS